MTADELVEEILIEARCRASAGGRQVDIEQLILDNPQCQADLLLQRYEDLKRLSMILPARQTSPALAAGSMVDEFKIEEEVGRGGMGVVYRAWQESLGRHVAVKVIRDCSISAHTREMFRREASAMAKLSHPNIVPVFGANRQSSPPYYMAMEYVKGRPLSALIRHVAKNSATGNSKDIFSSFVGRSPTNDSNSNSVTFDKPSDPLGAINDSQYICAICKMIIDVSHALYYAHQNGIIHQDVKPSNIIIDEDGRIRLFDFGLASLTTQPHVTVTGVFFGTPHYASPEQATGKTSDIDCRTDIYSLAATLYECLTLRPPFDAPTVEAVIDNVINSTPLAARKINPRITPRLNAAIMKSLSKKPSARHQNAMDFAASLEDAIADLQKINSPGLQEYDMAMKCEDKKSRMSFLSKAAKKGHAEAQFALAEILLVGADSKQNSQKAVAHLKAAAGNGYLAAKKMLGICYEEGLGTTKSYSSARKCFQEAAAQGDMESQYRLGRLYLDGRGTSKDVTSAIELFVAAQAQGHLDSAYQLGMIYLYGNGVEANHQLAIDYLSKAAKAGNIDSQILLALVYLEGIGIDQDISKADAWFEKASKVNALAMHYMGWRNELGAGRKCRSQKALEMYRKAANHGDRWAAQSLGEDNDEAPPEKNEEQYFELFLRLAKKNNIFAQRCLGISYEKGIGVRSNIAKAARWYQKASDNGDPVAQRKIWQLWLDGKYHRRKKDNLERMLLSAARKGDVVSQRLLGICYLNDPHWTQDLPQAAIWLEKASKQEDHHAKFILGGMYLEGNGVCQDQKKAFKLYAEAARLGNHDAKCLLDRMNGGKTDNIKKADPSPRDPVADNSPTGLCVLGNMYRDGLSVEKNYSKAAGFYRQAADHGNIEATYALGCMYRDGLGVDKDFSLARDFFGKSAEMGNADAQYALGCIYRNGDGVKPDYVQAAHWLRQSALQGNDAAQYMFGEMYRDGCGVERDDKQAWGWLVKSAELGNRNAQYSLGCMCRYGHGAEQSDHNAFQWLEKSAEQGHSEAQYCLACMYQEGQCVEKDITKALHWHQKSAEGGNAYAQYALGCIYRDGVGVEENYGKADDLFRLAAKQGNPQAQHAIGDMYRNGIGTDCNYAQAIDWYNMASQQGLPESQYELGQMYQKGLGVPSSESRAMEYYQAAAFRGNADAQYALGCIHINRGDYAPAVGWYGKAANQDHALAQLCLGLMYEKGTGVIKNIPRAIKYFKDAAINGKTMAISHIARAIGEQEGDSIETLAWLYLAAEAGDAQIADSINRAENAVGQDGISKAHDRCNELRQSIHRVTN